MAVDTVAHCDDTTSGDYVNSLTFTNLFSGWTENRAVGNKASHAILDQIRQLERVVPFPLRSFHSDNGSEFLNWPLYEYLTGRPLKVPWTRRRAYRKNDNAHGEQKNWTHVRQRLGCQRFAHPQRVPLLNDFYSKEWSRYQNHFRPTFKRLRRERQGGKTHTCKAGARASCPLTASKRAKRARCPRSGLRVFRAGREISRLRPMKRNRTPLSATAGKPSNPRADQGPAAGPTRRVGPFCLEEKD
ncbi:MAG TPA: hypothetical protein P5152_14335 [Candidatus Paceibacterota bacterium]|nr:hypothetical protein [Candidatus Paceibacterota bacterium]